MMDAKIVFLSALIHIGTSYPVSAFPLQYEVGKTFKYNYSTETNLNVPKSSQETKNGVGFKFSASIELTPVWTGADQILMKLQIAKPKLHSVARPDVARDLQGLPKKPVFFQWQGGKVRRVFASEEDSTVAINIKKGIISLFQLKVDDGTHTEVDASGECTVSYRKSGQEITRTKSNCQSVETAGQYSTAHPLLSVLKNSDSQTIYTIKDDLIQSAKSQETHRIIMSMDKAVSSFITMIQQFHLDGTSKGSTIKASNLEEAVENIKKTQKLSLYGMLLDTTFEAKQCSPDSLALPDVVEQLRDNLTPEKMAKTEAAYSFLKLVSVFRSSNKDAVLQIFKDTNNENIFGALLDAAAAAQTTATQAAILEILKFDDSYYIDNPERYILATAFSTHPSEELLQDMLNLYKSDIPSEKLYESVGGALGALVYTYCKLNQPCHAKVVKEIIKTLLDNVNNCEKPNCKPMAIRALANAGMVDTIPALLEHSETCTEMVLCEAAIKALRRMGNKNMNNEVKAVMRRIFFQKKRGYDSAVRTRALNILLDNEPTQEDITSMFRETMDPYNTEYDVYVQSRLFNLAKSDPQVRSMVAESLKDGNISNYHILSPKGNSLAFTETMAESNSFLATYFMFLENSRAGMIKRSGMDVVASGADQPMLVYGFGMFAAGLESLMGKDVDEGQEEVTATAGMALDLMDVSLRPLTFFTGSSGLMSAVWSAPSEPVSALQVNILLTDHLERLHLQNGLIVELDIQGALSLDLSGSLTVSLWNKNSKSLVSNSGGIAIQASTSIVTSPFKAGIQMSSDAWSVIDFRTDVDFYDGIKMCLQMYRPESVARQDVTRFEHARGFKKGYVAKTKKSKKIQSLSYPLPKPNNKQCRNLLGNS